MSRESGSSDPFWKGLEMTTRRKSTEGQEEILAPPCEIYRERGGADGRALDYWLEAELELKRLLRQQPHERETAARCRATRSGHTHQSSRRSSKLRTETRKKAEAA
jgi:hypothetical protein